MKQKKLERSQIREMGSVIIKSGGSKKIKAMPLIEKRAIMEKLGPVSQPLIQLEGEIASKKIDATVEAIEKAEKYSEIKEFLREFAGFVLVVSLPVGFFFGLAAVESYVSLMSKTQEMIGIAIESYSSLMSKMPVSEVTWTENFVEMCTLAAVPIIAVAAEVGLIYALIRAKKANKRADEQVEECLSPGMD